MFAELMRFITQYYRLESSYIGLGGLSLPFFHKAGSHFAMFFRSLPLPSLGAGDGKIGRHVFLVGLERFKDVKFAFLDDKIDNLPWSLA